MSLIKSIRNNQDVTIWNAAAFKGFFDYLKEKNAQVLFAFAVNDSQQIEVVTVQSFPMEKVRELLRECLAAMEKKPRVGN